MLTHPYCTNSVFKEPPLLKSYIIKDNTPHFHFYRDLLFVEKPVCMVCKRNFFLSSFFLAKSGWRYRIYFAITGQTEESCAVLFWHYLACRASVPCPRSTTMYGWMDSIVKSVITIPLVSLSDNNFLVFYANKNFTISHKLSNSS